MMKFAAAALATFAQAQKVSVELYYESQCPGCRQMITTSFAEAYQAEGFLEMADITLVPYGNAHGIDSCQHGVEECEYNMVESCALNLITDGLAQFNFINCIEQNDTSRKTSGDYDGNIDLCTAASGTDAYNSAIKTCYKGTEGQEYETVMMNETDALSPSHSYVPWVVGQGVHSDEVQNEVTSSLLSYVCSNYKGSNKSPDCPNATNFLQ